MNQGTRTIVMLSIVAALTGPLAAQTPADTPKASKPKPALKAYTPARTSWGDPDLQGTYTNKDENGIPLERPSQFEGKRPEDLDDSEFAEVVRERQQRAQASAAGIGGAETGAGPVHWYEHYGAKNSRAWLLIEPEDGRIPPTTPDADRRAAARAAARSGRGPADSYEDRSLYDQCITRGLPGSMMPAIYGNSYQILQGPGYVAVRYEMIHETRIIPLDGRPHLSPAIHSYMGDARGRFEGSTLVVETTNFDPRSAYRNGSEKLKIVERFTPVGPDKVQWSVRADDPATWTKSWAFAMILSKDPTQQVFEYACHEGNYGLRNILSAARAEEQKGR
jgi:hypothetical protein